MSVCSTFEEYAIGVMDNCFQADRYTVDDVLFNPTQYYTLKACHSLVPNAR